MSDFNLFNIKRILIIVTGGIGNLLFLMPTLKALRKNKDFHLSILVAEKEVKNIIELAKLADDVIEIENYSIIESIKVIKILRKKKFDLGIAAAGINPWKAGIIFYLAKCGFRLGETIGIGGGIFYNLKVPFKSDIHEADVNSSLVEKLGIKVEDKKLFFPVSNKDKEFARDFLGEGDYIGIYPGSGLYRKRFKNWDYKKFAELADLLAYKYNSKVVLLGAKVDSLLSKRLADLMKTKPVVATGMTTLFEAAAIISKCSLLIGSDGGLVHLAVALNVPVAAIFGPTNPKKVGPYSDNAIVVSANLPCSPCYRKGRVSCGYRRCLKKVSVVDVAKATDELVLRLDLI